MKKDQLFKGELKKTLQYAKKKAPEASPEGILKGVIDRIMPKYQKDVQYYQFVEALAPFYTGLLQKNIKSVIDPQKSLRLKAKNTDRRKKVMQEIIENSHNDNKNKQNNNENIAIDFTSLSLEEKNNSF